MIYNAIARKLKANPHISTYTMHIKIQRGHFRFAHAKDLDQSQSHKEYNDRCTVTAKVKSA